MSVVRGLVYKMNRMGPTTEPCGMPKLSKSGCEFVVGCNSLRSIGKVGSEPVERCTRNSTAEVLKSLGEIVENNGVKQSRQTKKSYDSYIVIVKSMQNVIYNFE